MGLIGKMDGPERVVFTWGIAVTFGWLGTMVLPNPVFAVTGIEPINAVLGWWLLLIGVAAINTGMEMYTRFGKNRLLLVWLVLVGFGLVHNIYAATRFVTVGPLSFSFLTLWFLLIGIGFAYTAYRLEAQARQLYGAAAGANIVSAGLILFFPGLMSVAYLAGMVFHGGPILAYWYLTYR